MDSLAVPLVLVALLWHGSQAKALPLQQDFDGQTCSQLARAVLSSIGQLLEDVRELAYFNRTSRHSRRLDNSTFTRFRCVVLIACLRSIQQEQLYKGFNCSEITAKTYNGTSTLSACAPAGSVRNYLLRL